MTTLDPNASRARRVPHFEQPLSRREALLRGRIGRENLEHLVASPPTARNINRERHRERTLHSLRIGHNMNEFDQDLRSYGDQMILLADALNHTASKRVERMLL